MLDVRRETDDGFEETWAVNVLAPYLLTGLLLPLLQDRVVNVSSISAGSSIDWDNLQQEKGYSDHGAYSLSKLAMQMLTVRMAQLLQPRGLQVACLDPGTVNTKVLLAG
jgi:NAD(P)-dependent dehydrogenase (short-subunit alcohol dehydrogenase family)